MTKMLFSMQHTFLMYLISFDEYWELKLSFPPWDCFLTDDVQGLYLILICLKLMMICLKSANGQHLSV